MTAALQLGAAALLGLVLGRAIGLPRRRLLLEAQAALAEAGPGADLAAVHYHLRRRWSARAAASALAELERLGLVRGLDGDPSAPGHPERRRYFPRAGRPRASES